MIQNKENMLFDPEVMLSTFMRHILFLLHQICTFNVIKVIKAYLINSNNSDISVTVRSFYDMDHPKATNFFQSFVLSTLLIIFEVNCYLTPNDLYSDLTSYKVGSTQYTPTRTHSISAHRCEMTIYFPMGVWQAPVENSRVHRKQKM